MPTRRSVGEMWMDKTADLYSFNFVGQTFLPWLCNTLQRVVHWLHMIMLMLINDALWGSLHLNNSMYTLYSTEYITSI